MRANEFLSESYQEIEFVCANPEFPDATDPNLQQHLYKELKKINGVIPVLQDQSDYSEGQYSLTAIFRDSRTKRKILSLAKQLGVQVDLIQPVSDDYVDRAISGEHEGQILGETPEIKIPGNQRAKEWIQKVYDLYPGMWQNNHVMAFGEGDDKVYCVFELSPSFTKRDAVEVKWIQAMPLRSGAGTKGMQELQRLAREDGISLTLFPWDKGQVSQTALTKFYKKQGYKPVAKGSKNMYWSPDN